MGDKEVNQDLNLKNNDNNNDTEATSQTPLLSSQEPPQTPYDSLSAAVVQVQLNDSSANDGIIRTSTYDGHAHGHAIGRALLLTVAFLYGTLNVVLRLIYSQPGPPSASVLSTTRGWLAVVCFIPFLAKQNVDQQTKVRTTERRQDENELEFVNNDIDNGASLSQNGMLSQEYTAPINNPGQQQRVQFSPSTASFSQNGMLSQEDTFLPTNPGQQRVQFSPSVIANTSRSRSFWKMAVELAVLNFGAQALINLGLLSVSSARAAFLTQTSVVLTPAVSALVGRKVHPKVWLACLAALGGLLLMSHEEGQSGFGHFQFGDLLCLGGALSWSLYIFRLSYCEMFDEIELQAAKTFFLAVLYTGWFVAAFIQSETCLWVGWTSLFTWALLFYSALGPGTLADVMQQKGQVTVTAAEANVILSMEPVFTAILGRLFLGEVTSMQDRFGGGLIILSALVATT
jgi:drug/metabolite transporter (DMT)-like permease